MKENVLKFIRDFSKMTIKNICSDLGVDKDNLYKGKCSDEKTVLVADEIIRRYDCILEEYRKNVVDSGKK